MNRRCGGGVPCATTPDYRIDELDKESVSPRTTVTAHPKMDTFVGGRGVGDDWWGPVGLAPAPVVLLPVGLIPTSTPPRRSWVDVWVTRPFRRLSLSGGGIP